MDDPNDLVFAGGSGWLAGRDHDFEYLCLSARLPDYQCQRNDRLFASNQPILFVVRNGEYQRNRNFRFVCGWIFRLMGDSGESARCGTVGGKIFEKHLGRQTYGFAVVVSSWKQDKNVPGAGLKQLKSSKYKPLNLTRIISNLKKAIMIT